MSNSRDIADSAATINFIDGLTSDAQTQIDSKDSFPSQTGNADKYLTTDGTNASWAAVAGGTTTATASGTISAGDPLVVNSDGTVSTIASTEYTLHASIPRAIGTNEYVYNADIVDSQNVAFDPIRNMYFTMNTVGYFDGYQTLYGHRTYQWFADEYHQPTMVKSHIKPDPDASSYFKPHAVAVDYLNGQWLSVGNRSNNTNDLRYMSGRYNESSATEDQDTSNNPDLPFVGKVGCGAAFDEVSGDFIILYIDTNNILKINSCYFQTPTARQLNNRATATINSTNDDKTYAANIFWHQPTRQAIITYNKNSTGVYCRVATYNGSSFVLGTEQTVGTQQSDTENELVYYQKDEDCFIFAYKNTSGYPELRPATLSGSTFTFNTAVAPMSQNGLTRQWSSCELSNSKLYVAAGTNFCVATMTNQEITGASSNFNASISNRAPVVAKGGNTYYLRSCGTVIMPYTYDINYGAMASFYSSNNKGNNFIGFAADNYTDGQTATITISSGINSQQSGLTVGKGHYVDIHGDIVTGKSGQQIGISKSATELLVK
jgi:hypothetical protein